MPDHRANQPERHDRQHDQRLYVAAEQAREDDVDQQDSHRETVLQRAEGLLRLELLPAEGQRDARVSLDQRREGRSQRVHDGVRPLVSDNTIHNVFETAREKGNAVPVVKINESVRKLGSGNSFPVDRKSYCIIQTPQCFHADLLLKAYEQDYNESFTDDATVVESLGEKINLVDGNFENIKITRPVDLKFAEAYLK